MSMNGRTEQRRQSKALLLILLPFALTVLVFSVLNRGTTLEVHRNVLWSVALLSVALVLPPVVIYSTRQGTRGSEELSKVRAYRMSGSWTFVVILRCVLVGAAAALCSYLWLRMIGERIDGQIEEVEARVVKLSTAGTPRGGCHVHATFSLSRGEADICASHAWQQPLLPTGIAEGQLALLTLKRNAISTSVTAARIIE